MKISKSLPKININQINKHFYFEAYRVLNEEENIIEFE